MMNLSAEQAVAAYSTEPRCIIEAGPGSGKTRVLTARVVHLVVDRRTPWQHVLCLTFTRKAAGEMRRRIAEAVGDESLAYKLQVSTIHAWCLKMIRMFPDIAYRRTGFALWTPPDVVNVVNMLLRDNDRKEVQAYKVEGLLKKDSFVRDLLVKAKHESNALTYDDMSEAVISGLQDHHGFREYVSNRARYILLDEAQDTSERQHRLLEALDAEWTLIGDRRQAIYEWRDAQPDTLKTIGDDGVKVYNIRANWRSSSNIVDLANRIADNMPNPAPPQIAAGEHSGLPVKVVTHARDAIGDSFIRGYKPKDICILGRTWAQLGRTVNECERHPVVLSRGANHPLMAPEVRKVLALARLTLNKYDDWACRMVLDLSPEAYRRGQQMAAKRDDALVEHTAIRDLVKMLQFHADSARDWLLDVARCKLFLFNSEGPKALLDILCEVQSVQGTLSLQQFVDEVAQMETAQDVIEDTPDEIQAMTVHAAKGLEFPVVIVDQCVEGCFPLGRDEPNEARRLFYVAVTRAKDLVHLVVPERKFKFHNPKTGLDVLEDAEPSRFLVEAGVVE